MADVKCGRCDRRYSKFRSRCPYCGALRSKKSKRAVDNDNAVWKVVVGASILILLIAAVAAILIMTYAGKNTPDSTIPAPSGSDTSQQGESNNNGTGDDEAGGIDSNGVDTIDGEDSTGGDNGQPEPEPEPTEPVLNSISITTRGGDPRTDITMHVKDVVRLSYRTDPEDFDGKAEWSSSNENVFIVLQSGELTAVSTGTETLKVTMGDKTSECIVRVIP